MSTDKLPDGWTRVRFGDVVRKVSDRVDPDTAGIERYVAGEHMDTDDLTIRRWGRVGDGYLGPAFHMRFRPGQVLYGSRRTYLRKVAVPDFVGITANTTFVLEPSSKDLLPEFLPLVMTTEAFHGHSIEQSKGSVNPYINFSDLTWYEFALPPLEEQARLAELLAASRRIVERTAAAMTCIDQLLASLVTDSYKYWAAHGVIVKVPQFGDLTMGRQKAPKYERGTNPVPYLRVADIGHLEVVPSDPPSMDFTAIEVSRYGLRPGDVLITEGDIVSAANVGRAAVFEAGPDPCCFQNTLIRLRPAAGVESYFAVAMIEGARLCGLLAAAAGTTTVSHLGLKKLSSVALPMAPASDQQVVARQLRNAIAFRSQLREQAKSAAAVARTVRSEAGL